MTPLDHISILFLPATPIVEVLATGRRRIWVLERRVAKKGRTLCGEEQKADSGTYGPRFCCQMRWRECVFWKCLLEGCKIRILDGGKRAVRGERGWRKLPFHSDKSLLSLGIYQFSNLF